MSKHRSKYFLALTRCFTTNYQNTLEIFQKIVLLMGWLCPCRMDATYAVAQWSRKIMSGLDCLDNRDGDPARVCRAVCALQVTFGIGIYCAIWLPAMAGARRECSRGVSASNRNAHAL